jgi:hypothetical protein
MSGIVSIAINRLTAAVIWMLETTLIDAAAVSISLLNRGQQQ